MIPCTEAGAGYSSQGTANPTCSYCTDGTYCQTASDPATFSVTTCPAGRYCIGDVVYPCPKGTYGILSGQDAESDCTDQPCGVGYACIPFNRRSSCNGGYFCSSTMATTPKPVIDDHGGQMCLPGTFCEPRAQLIEPCPAGRYCSEY